MSYKIQFYYLDESGEIATSQTPEGSLRVDSMITVGEVDAMIRAHMARHPDRFVMAQLLTGGGRELGHPLACGGPVGQHPRGLVGECGGPELDFLHPKTVRTVIKHTPFKYRRVGP